MDKDLHKLFSGYLQGSLSGDEESDLIAWVTSSEKNIKYFRKYVSENRYLPGCAAETNAAWERICPKLRPHARFNNAPGKGAIFPAWIKIAALIVFAFISGFLIHNINLGQDNGYALNEIIVPKGEKSQLVLSDGSKVFLNSGTCLRYPAAFNKTNRRVILSGEAFFEIKKDQAHPFLVETNKFSVKVTGTSFNLAAYGDDKESSLTLHSGIVTIDKNGMERKIKPGEKYILNNLSNRYKVVHADIKKSSVWRNDVIVIDDQSLDEIIKILERNFDVTIEIGDSNLKNIRYSGQFKPHETLGEILALIKGASPIKFKVIFNKSKDYVTIKQEI